ncbi:MAG: thioredoxin [Bacteroidales bacterium]|nr:thioredoxin [Bacteroidales bacterium]
MQTFQEIINSNTPVLVDFHATWCGPCKAMAPTIETIGREVQGKARVLKIDVDKNPAVAAKYQIQSVPTLMIFKNGNIVWRQSGGMDKMYLKNVLMGFV